MLQILYKYICLHNTNIIIINIQIYISNLCILCFILINNFAIYLEPNTLFRVLMLLYFLISVSINKITILCCTIKIVE